MEKREVEEILGCSITEDQFKEALEYAQRKQKHIYEREKNNAVLQQWYLVKLTEEYVRNLAFSKLTVDLCRELRNMEKEHLTHCVKGTPTATHIVSVLAL